MQLFIATLQNIQSLINNLLFEFMLHELLMSMLGRTGNIIKQYDNCFIVDPSLSFFTQAETKLVNEIAQVGFYYSRINKFIEIQLTELSFADFRKQPSVYRKAMAHGLKKALVEYQQLILGIQNDFLNHRHFTFSNIRAETTKFQLILKQIDSICQNIKEQKYRGGIIIDIFAQIYQKGSQWVREWLVIILKQCQNVFIQQVIAWIAHGQIIDHGGQFFIHKVIQQPDERFSFSKTHKNIEITGWDMYTLEEEMIPLSLISIQTASKILFIGKSVKILKSSDKISAIPGVNVLNDIKRIFDNQNSQVLLQSVIQKIRHSIAQEMIKLIIGQQNLLRQLEKINDYYLMFKGDFYHHFLEEAKCIESITQKQRVQKKINQTCLPNTFMRLSNLQDSKRVQFQIKSIGFNYIGFKNFINMCPVGNIDLIEGRFIRFSSSGGAIWHRTKQIVEHNFTVMYTLSYKKSKNVFKTRKQDSKEKRSNLISLVIQNSKDISPTFHQNPSALSKIPQYLSINIGYQYSQKQKNYLSFVEVKYRNDKKFQKEIQLSKIYPKKINFLDEAVYIVKIAYVSLETIKISINPSNSYDSSQQNITNIDNIRISNYIDLQMGRANIGFISKISDSDCLAQIQQWEMECKTSNHFGDHWSDISLNMKMNWPINLILTPDLMEIFASINKFLFPVRKVQIQLQSTWMKISRKMKQEKNRAYDNSLNKRQLEKFQRNISSCRTCMHQVINNLWSYFMSDVAQSAWQKLKISIQGSDDFEEVINMISKYVKTIQIMYYFHMSKIHRNIFEIVRQCRGFVTSFNRMCNEIIDESTVKQFQNLNQNFKKTTLDFSRLLKDLSKASSSNHLFHLTNRMQSCVEKQREGHKYF